MQFVRKPFVMSTKKMHSSCMISSPISWELDLALENKTPTIFLAIQHKVLHGQKFYLYE